MENEAIEFCAKIFNWGMVQKNTKHFSNEFISGEPDLILSDSVAESGFNYQQVVAVRPAVFFFRKLNFSKNL